MKQKEVDAIKERQDAISELFMLKLNDAVEGRINLPDNEFMEVKWSPRSRTNVDMETLKIRFPDAYNQCVSVNPESSRVFSIKRKKVRTRKSDASSLRGEMKNETHQPQTLCLRKEVTAFV